MYIPDVVWYLWNAVGLLVLIAYVSWHGGLDKLLEDDRSRASKVMGLIGVFGTPMVFVPGAILILAMILTDFIGPRWAAYRAEKAKDRVYLQELHLKIKGYEEEEARRARMRELEQQVRPFDRVVVVVRDPWYVRLFGNAT